MKTEERVHHFGILSELSTSWVISGTVNRSCCAEPIPVVEPIPVIEPIPVVEPIPLVESIPLLEPVPVVEPVPKMNPIPAIPILSILKVNTIPIPIPKKAES